MKLLGANIFSVGNRWISGCRAIVGWHWPHRNELHGHRPVTVPVCPQQVLRGMASDQILTICSGRSVTSTRWFVPVWNLGRAVVAKKAALVLANIWDRYRQSDTSWAVGAHCMWLFWHVTFDTLDQCCIPRLLYIHSNRQWPVLYTATAEHSQCQTVTSAVYPDSCTLKMTSVVYPNSWTLTVTSAVYQDCCTLTVTGSDQCCIPRQLYTYSNRQWPVLYTQTAVHSQCRTVTSAVYPDSCTLTVSYSALQSAPTHEWSVTLHSVGENPSGVPRPKGRHWETRYRLLSCQLRFPSPVCCSVLLWISGRRRSCWISVLTITSSLWN